jgi:hypothetical protein
MIDPDARLSELFAYDLPAPRDPVFQVTVLDQLARRAFFMDLASQFALSLAGGCLLWLLWPTLSSTLGLMGRGLAPGVTCVLVAASILAITNRSAPYFRS